jgi:ketosteroid isomerase-like protein
MSVEDNKELVLSWFEAAFKGDTERWLDLIHDDFRYWAPGRMPFTGWSDKDGFMATAELLGRYVAGPMTLKIGAVTAEDDRVVLQTEGDVLLSNGERYNNVYMMCTKVRDGKIVEYIEFFDSLYVYQTFDAPEVRGAQKPRESHITEVTRTLTGGIPDAVADGQAAG